MSKICTLELKGYSSTLITARLLRVSISILFPHFFEEFYNPGQKTGVLGLGIIGIYYFTTVFESGMYLWYDYVLAVLWFIVVFWFCFRSPLYWGLGKKDGYELPDQTAFGQWEKRVLNK